jgi:hypothetical protein
MVIKTLLEIIDTSNEPHSQLLNMKTRIEIHLLETEVETLDKIAEQDGRSRKNYCETAICSIIQSFEGGQKKQKLNKNGKAP